MKCEIPMNMNVLNMKSHCLSDTVYVGNIQREKVTVTDKQWYPVYVIFNHSQAYSSL